ncbi:MAG TPA: hypothetical protein VGM90_29965 [Kofleriaceae bacterium]|jgi:hypothetical protein
MRVHFSLVVVCALFGLGSCGAGETRIDPADLELRDLLGLSPDVALEWNAEQRAAARSVIATGFDEEEPATQVALVDAPTADQRVAATLAAMDAKRDAAGAKALGLVTIASVPVGIDATPHAAHHARSATTGTAASPAIEIVLANEWDAHSWARLPARGLDVLTALADDAGHHSGPLTVAPSARLTVIASYEGGRLLVNPIALAALEPDRDEVALATQLERATPVVGPARIATPDNPYAAVTDEAKKLAAAGGNPYSFYGSIGECAAAQRTRCEACLPSGNCEPITNTDGTTECNRLAEDDGRGYFLICANLAIAINSVNNCALDKAPSCPHDETAANRFDSLEANAAYVDDPACGQPLDKCLSDIYGAPDQQFPTYSDGGVEPAPTQPRDTSVNCGDGCSNSQTNNCEFSPSCNVQGPSCNNSASCDSTCSDSNSGGNSSCDSCNNDTSSSSGNSGGDCSSCNSDSGSSSSGGNDNCGGGSGDSGCGGGGCSGNGGNGCSSSSSSNSSCNVARKDDPKGEGGPGWTLILSLGWAFAPIPVAGFIRRRSKKRGASTIDDEPSPVDDASIDEEEVCS